MHVRLACETERHKVQEYRNIDSTTIRRHQLLNFVQACSLCFEAPFAFNFVLLYVCTNADSIKHQLLTESIGNTGINYWHRALISTCMCAVGIMVHLIITSYYGWSWLASLLQNTLLTVNLILFEIFDSAILLLKPCHILAAKCKRILLISSFHHTIESGI